MNGYLIKSENKYEFVIRSVPCNLVSHKTIQRNCTIMVDMIHTTILGYLSDNDFQGDSCLDDIRKDGNQFKEVLNKLVCIQQVASELRA